MQRYIEREKAFEVLTDYYHQKTLIQRVSLKEALGRVPTADVRENVHAVWLPIFIGEKGYSAGDFRCSACGEPNKCFCLTNFCPNCGANMRGEDNAKIQHHHPGT